MTIYEALDKALVYETRIRDLYAQAAADATLPEAKAFFDFLAVDEDRHVSYIERARLDAKNGTIPDASTIETALPTDIPAAIEKAKAAFHTKVDGGKLTALENALRAEEETSAFYRKLVFEFSGDEGKAFKRLLEIEDGHTAIVRAELDAVTRSGFWFDVREFDMEH